MKIDLLHFRRLLDCFELIEEDAWNELVVSFLAAIRALIVCLVGVFKYCLIHFSTCKSVEYEL